MPAYCLLTLLLICLASFGEAQTTLEYWHSQDAAQSTVQALADAFNTSQSEYRVLPRYVGNYQEGAIKLIAALGGADQPVLFNAEVTVFPRLVEEGALADLSDLTAALPPTLLSDIYPALWRTGELGGGRYGLPWNMSAAGLVL